jgi:TolB-like protein/DNA-binding winged helix-turn-helix (wHTH) protein/cytochrome c-type biogenesis protein CcmH/NrfG
MPGAQPDQRVTPVAFRLKDLQVDLAIGLVTGPAGSVRLEPRVMAVLERLARRPGELVTRADLLAEIWPGGDVYDEALTQCVYQLRQQLVSVGGDDCRNLITTVPKRGYLLNAEAQPVEPALNEVEAPAASRSRRPALLGVLATLLVLATAWTLFEWRSAPGRVPAAPQTTTIAVLPFLPLAEENREPALELGMADTLIGRLGGIRQVIVRPTPMVRRYGGIDRDSLQAGRELGADAVVDGSIQRSGDSMRVTARLLRVADGAALWAGTFDEQFSGIFAVQDKICERIAAALALELGPQDRQNLARGGTSNTAAYELYLQGRLHLTRLTPPEMEASIGYFREAIALDPGYALAWLGLANALSRMPMAAQRPPNEFYPQAKLAAQGALRIDDSLAEGHAILGWIAFWFDWDWAESEARFRHAIQLNPNDTESHLGYAHLLSNTGRHEEALREVRRARETNPLFWLAAALEGGFLLQAGRPEEALAQLEEARRMNPDFWITHLTLGGVYDQLGRYAEALVESGLARQLSGGSTNATATEIGILVHLGRRAEAEPLLAEMIERAATEYIPPYHFATAYMGLDDADEALAWLERGFGLRDPNMTFMGVDPDWAALRSRPEFTDLLHRMNLQLSPL